MNNLNIENNSTNKNNNDENKIDKENIELNETKKNYPKNTDIHSIINKTTTTTTNDNSNNISIHLKNIILKSLGITDENIKNDLLLNNSTSNNILLNKILDFEIQKIIKNNEELRNKNLKLFNDSIKILNDNNNNNFDNNSINKLIDFIDPYNKNENFDTNNNNTFSPLGKRRRFENNSNSILYNLQGHPSSTSLLPAAASSSSSSSQQQQQSFIPTIMQQGTNQQQHTQFITSYGSPIPSSNQPGYSNASMIFTSNNGYAPQQPTFLQPSNANNNNNNNAQYIRPSPTQQNHTYFDNINQNQRRGPAGAGHRRSYSTNVLPSGSNRGSPGRMSQISPQRPMNFLIHTPKHPPPK